jgi:hypothetical protein
MCYLGERGSGEFAIEEEVGERCGEIGKCERGAVVAELLRDFWQLNWQKEAAIGRKSL